MRKKSLELAGYGMALVAMAMLFREHIFPAVGGKIQDQKEESFVKHFAREIVQRRPEFFVKKTNVSGKNAQVYFELQSLSKTNTELPAYQEQLGAEVASTFCALVREPNTNWGGEALNVLFVRPSEEARGVFLIRSVKAEQCRA